MNECGSTFFAPPSFFSLGPVPERGADPAGGRPFGRAPARGGLSPGRRPLFTCRCRHRPSRRGFLRPRQAPSLPLGDGGPILPPLRGVVNVNQAGSGPRARPTTSRPAGAGHERQSMGGGSNLRPIHLRPVRGALAKARTSTRRSSAASSDRSPTSRRASNDGPCPLIAGAAAARRGLRPSASGAWRAGRRRSPGCDTRSPVPRASARRGLSSARTGALRATR